MTTSINNSYAAAPSIYDISVTILNAQLVSAISMIVASTFGLIIGLVQIATTIFWKPLRKMDQSLIFALAVADCLKTAGIGCLIAPRLYVVATGGNNVENQLMCMVRLSFIMLPKATVFLLIIMLSLDRLCALAFPIWYKNRKTSFRIAQIVLCCISGCSIGATLFIGVSRDKLVPVCSYASSPNESFLYFISYFENSCVFCTLGINAISCALLLQKWRKARKTKQTLSVFKKNVQLGALKMLTAVVLVYLISSAASSVWLMVFNWFGLSEDTRMRYTAISGLFELFRGVLDFPLYIMLVRDYRNGFREVVLKKICCCLPFVGHNGSSLHVVARTSVSAQRCDASGAVGRRMTRVEVCGA